MKKIILILGILLLSISLVLSNGDHQSEIEEGKKLVESKVSCDKLSDEQLEEIGEYLMEQMHPSEAHETMDKMMGGEGSENLKQVHINMAKMMYCNEGNMMSNGMMGGGMMNMMGNNMMGGNTMQGMSNNSIGFNYWSFWNILWLLFWIGIIVLIVWLIYKSLAKKETLSETPVNILKKRYVEGEITKKEYEEMKREISK